MTGKTGITLAGKPDLIAIKDGEGVIVDAKTGQPKDADPVQVMIYMWAVPLAMPRFKGIKFGGRVVYANNSMEIPASQVDVKFKSRLAELIIRIGGNEPCTRIPSPNECQFCPIAASECPERMESGMSGENDSMTDAF